jgi:Transposase DDE domain
MDLLTDLAVQLQTLFTRDADDAARATGFLKRQRKLSGSTFVQTLVFGWLRNPHASLDDLTEFAADLGLELTPQALDQRLRTPATHLLAALLSQAWQRVFEAQPLALPLLRRFQGVYVFDTTTVSLPATLATLFAGCGGRTAQDGQAALKLHVGLELTGGALQLACGDGRTPDVSSELARGPLPPGALRLADCGFFNLEVLRDYSDAGVNWLTRVPAHLKVWTAAGEERSLVALLSQANADTLDLPVQAGKEARLPCRLIALRVPAAVAQKRRQRLLARAKKAKKGKRQHISAAQWTLCEWQIALTNVSAGVLSAAEAWVLLRARWQVELLFKLWKSHGGLDESLGRRAERVLCEVYAKLLAMLVQHWSIVVSAGAPLGCSHVKAARRVRRAAVRLAQALGDLLELVGVLQQLARRIQKRCRVQRRGKRPTTYELLRDPSQPQWLPEEEDEEHLEAA